MYDRVRLDFTSDVTTDDRAVLLNGITNHARSLGLYTYQHYDKEAGAWSVDITAHDRTRTVDLTDGQIVARLKTIADSSGVSVQDILKQAAREALR